MFKPVKFMVGSKIGYGMAYMITKFLLPRMHRSIQNFKPLTVEDYCRHKSKVDKLQKSFIEWWKSLGLDHVITPGLGCQACPTELLEKANYAGIYTFIWNLLNMSVGAQPISLVR